MAQLTKEQAILRGMWTKACQDRTLRLPPMPKAQAQRVRFILFREAKQMRAEAAQGLVDAFLVEQMESITIRLYGLPTGLFEAVMEEKGDANIIALGEALGIEISPAEGQQNLVEESLRKLQTLTNGTDFNPLAHRFSAPEPTEPTTHAALEPAKHNPFYKRES